MTMPTEDDLLLRVAPAARLQECGAPLLGGRDGNFALGSTRAHELVRRYGLDPDEMVKR